MTATHPLPRTGSIFLDARGDTRALRVSWHPEADMIVLSLWEGNVCTGTFRLPADRVPDLIDTLVDVLRARRAPVGPAPEPVRPPLYDAG